MPELKSDAQRSPLTSVVVATDFSLGAVWALKRAARLPLAPEARVSILHVLPRDLPQRLRTAAGAFVGHRLERAVRLFAAEAYAAGNSQVRVTGDLARGRAFVEVIRHARRKKAELVILGRHGRRAFRDLLIGTTAQRVVRESDVPVLVVNLEPAAPYRRPLLATDLEPASRDIAKLAAQVIDPQATTVSVIHAYDVPFEGWISLGDHGEGKSHYRRLYREEASKGLKRFVASRGDVGLRMRPRVCYGDPRFVVLEEAKRRRADLVMLGTHGRSGVARALLGTVAETVVAEATCDVLIARPSGLSVRLP